MHEHVRSAVALDEAEALRVVEPFHGAGDALTCHSSSRLAVFARIRRLRACPPWRGVLPQLRIESPTLSLAKVHRGSPRCSWMGRISANRSSFSASLAASLSTAVGGAPVVA